MALIKTGLMFPFTMYAWIYALVKTGMIKGIFHIVFRSLDVIEYLLDLHDAITKKVEKYDQEKKVCDKQGSGVLQYLDMNSNQDKKAKFYETGHVSFTVAQTQFESDLEDQVMTFDQVISNECDGFDSNNGKFSCPIPGVYVFFFSNTNYGDKDVVSLIQDDVLVDASLYENNGGSKVGDQVSHMAVLQLKKNDQVWLKCAKDADVKTKDLKFATFSGFLLYEQ
ncbi:caprin-2-like [Amphiura filiformis]|uniref:caprin-2-like n=1 Tax=Amphiura filiformis TaxID=82378 RepID=UPI003B22603E